MRIERKEKFSVEKNCQVGGTGSSRESHNYVYWHCPYIRFWWILSYSSRTGDTPFPTFLFSLLISENTGISRDAKVGYNLTK